VKLNILYLLCRVFIHVYKLNGRKLSTKKHGTTHMSYSGKQCGTFSWDTVHALKHRNCPNVERVESLQCVTFNLVIS